MFSFPASQICSFFKEFEYLDITGSSKWKFRVKCLDRQQIPPGRVGKPTVIELQCGCRPASEPGPVR
jgi:hypothetical protein